MVFKLVADKIVRYVGAVWSGCPVGQVVDLLCMLTGTPIGRPPLCDGVNQAISAGAGMGTFT